MKIIKIVFFFNFLKIFNITDRVHILEDRSLRLDNVIIDDEGEYSCEADNAVGSITLMGSLIVHCTLL